MRYLDRYIAHEDVLDSAERLLRGETERLLGYVKQSALPELCALAFLYTTEDAPLFTTVYAWSSHDRGALPVSDVDRVWQPADWDHDLDLGVPDRPSREQAEEIADAIEGPVAARRRLERGGPRDSSVARPFLLDLSAHLNRLDWSAIAPVTDDFVVWSNEHELAELNSRMFQSIAPTHVSNAYAQRGWLEWLDQHSMVYDE